MEIKKTVAEELLTLAVSGRLETGTAEQLESEIGNVGESVKKLRLDFTDLEYVSSAGLRVILNAHKTLRGRNATLEIAGAGGTVKRVFDITGFSPILNFV